MRVVAYFVAVLTLSIVVTPSALAADDGNTNPQLSYASISTQGGYAYLVNTTSGPGNLKGIRCNGGFFLAIDITVNGGTTRTIYPAGLGGSNDSGWIPMNIRWTSSISVKLYHSNGLTSEFEECYASYGFD
jgi:hypothetical protein